MSLKDFLCSTYPVSGPYVGINSIENSLLEHGFLVVYDDEEKEFCGILSPADIIKHPHKLVIDSVTNKDFIGELDSIHLALGKFQQARCDALAFIEDGQFKGVIRRQELLGKLENIIKELENKALVSEKTKMFFINNLAHEVRTPLNSILGFLDIISDIQVEEPPTMEQSHVYDSEGVAYIRQSAERFLMTMNDIIELSLLYADKSKPIQVNKDWFVIEGLFLELKELFTCMDSLYSKEKVEVSYCNPLPEQRIFTDRNRLKHALFHLIENAVKFSKDRKASFGFKQVKGKHAIHFFVINECSVMSEETSGFVFDLFTKQEQVGEDINFGLGVGLPLIKKTIESMGGKVGMMQKNSKVHFFIELPISEESS